MFNCDPTFCWLYQVSVVPIQLTVKTGLPPPMETPAVCPGMKMDITPVGEAIKTTAGSLGKVTLLA